MAWTSIRNIVRLLKGNTVRFILSHNVNLYEEHFFDAQRNQQTAILAKGYDGYLFRY